ncbi:hypothetical protein O6P43_008015 [Quillaja saponaria]|uniref:Uncharacterized protein n=1 Tax=Quillaja saponaria TaxID=32244 RepID=A0AAD7M4F5_QUISA|nr:hypothetical protein O6P43_008015 [Quillaja saponaria]
MSTNNQYSFVVILNWALCISNQSDRIRIGIGRRLCGFVHDEDVLENCTILHHLQHWNFRLILIRCSYQKRKIVNLWLEVA